MYNVCLYRSYWKPSVMGDHLEEAAKFSKSRESTLNVSDYVSYIIASGTVRLLRLFDLNAG